MEEPTRSTTRFIAIDGEGDDKRTYTRPDGTVVSEQWYSIMACSLGEKEAMFHVKHEERQRLTTLECLDWLTNLARTNPGAVFIGYGLSYDINMILRDLSFKQLSELHGAHAHASKHFKLVQAGAYGLQWLRRKYLRVVKYKTKANGKLAWKLDSKGKYHRIVDVDMTLWDVIGFFQGSFLHALEEYGMAPADLYFIRQMKAARGTLQEHSTEEIIRYSTRECQILVELMQQVEHYLAHPGLDIHLKKWGGAGYIAAALLEKHCVKEHIAPLPPPVLEAALHAFSGGRIELIRYGHTGTVYAQDVNSCYPAAETELPSLAGGTWSYHERPLYADMSNPYTLLLITWSLWDPKRRIYPFAYRAADDTISYPATGMSWVYMSEYKAAMRHADKYAGGRITVHGLWQFHPGTTVMPFDFIRELAALRLEWKAEHKRSNKASGGQHITAKYGLNSTYGKTAQQVGGFIDGNAVKLPPFHNMFYAGYITAWGRAKLYDTAMQDEDAIIMFATDGLFSTRPLVVDEGPNLGQWERSNAAEMLAVQSGVYLTRDARDGWHKKTRGFSPSAVTPEMILNGWYTGDTSLKSELKRFVTFGFLATSTNNPDTAMARYCNWETTQRDLRLNPYGTKRYNLLNDEYATDRNPVYGLLATYPLENETPHTISKQYEYVYLVASEALTEEQRAYIEEMEGIDEVD
jgi:hypothetical protein